MPGKESQTISRIFFLRDESHTYIPQEMRRFRKPNHSHIPFERAKIVLDDAELFTSFKLLATELLAVQKILGITEFDLSFLPMILCLTTCDDKRIIEYLVKNLPNTEEMRTRARVFAYLQNVLFPQIVAATISGTLSSEGKKSQLAMQMIEAIDNDSSGSSLIVDGVNDSTFIAPLFSQVLVAIRKIRTQMTQKHVSIEKDGVFLNWFKTLVNDVNKKTWRARS